MRNKNAYLKFGDKQLIAMLKRGDHSAFAEILHRYFTLLFSFSYRRMETRDQARDLVHNLFVNMWETRAQLIIEDPLETYLMENIKNRLLDHYRHAKISRKYIETLGAYLNDPKNEFPVPQKDIKALIEMEVAALPEKMRIAYQARREPSMNE